MLKFKLNRSLKGIIPGITIAVVSLQLFWGIIIGYIISKIMAGKETGQSGILKSITFQVGSYKLHLHHWLLGLIVLVVALVGNFYVVSPNFFYGVLGGCILQGIVCYKDWTKILIKQRD